MPYTVAVSFDRFLENISLTGDHREIAKSRHERIVSLLGNTFTIVEAFPTGSIPRLTALKSKADLDVMVALHYSKHIKDRSPEQVLQAVRDALGDYRTNVRKNGQAVTLYYESWPDVDIVPVSRSTNDDGSVNHYNVPDMNSGRWLSARPRKHSTALDEKAKSCGSSFRPVIRMIKEWNSSHSGLLQSFHIEVLAMRIFDHPITEYTWAIHSFFDGAVKLAASPLPYEDNVADDYLDWSTRRDVVSRLEAARDKSLQAWHLTYGGKSEHEKAIGLWRQIFGDRFPSYG
jgi:hypothetical protein